VLADTSPNGSSIGHPGGPVGVGLVPAPRTPVIHPRGGFDWGDAGVGAGFIAGLGLFATGAALMLRKRGVLADLHL
jgi:hypothetical protein